MAQISAADVKRLRDATGAGMMDSKKALDEAGGDFDQAVEILRVKAGAKVARRGAERNASNGLIAAAEGAMIELASETDFVAKNEQFQTLAGDIVAHFAASSAADVAALLTETLRDGRTVAENIDVLAGVIGEKLELRRAVKVDGQVAEYLHKKAADLPPQVGVLVQFTGTDLQAARGAAMQVAAMRPRYLARTDVPSDVVDNERRVLEAKAREDGKPEAALPKIVDGMLNGFFKDNVLLEQAAVQDNKKTGRARRAPAGVLAPAFAHARAGGPTGGARPAELGQDRRQVAPTKESPMTESWPAPAPAYRRVMLKLSGEVFGGGAVGVDPDVVQSLAQQIAEVVRGGTQVAIVVGGGNFFRGPELSQRGMERSRADYMGMLGTVMNCLALQDFLEQAGIPTRVQTAITMGQVAEPYIPRRAERHLEKGRVVIFGAGAGMPYFSTDTVAAQRALEISCEVLLLGKNGVDGIYDADPRTHPEAVKFDTISYDEVLARGLAVADAAAFSLCRENGMPIVVFSLDDGNIARVVRGEKIGTLVSHAS